MHQLVPDDLGAALERSTPAAVRRARGVHFTPRGVADELTAVALGHRRGARVLDPACGGGAFLLAAARALEARGVDRRDVVTLLHGVDVDPLAVETTRRALAMWAGAAPPAGNVVVADALLDELPWHSFDVVVGNPPFLGQLARATARGARERAALRARYGDAVAPYTDAAWLFLLRACALARPGGTVVMLQPQSVLASRDAGPVRAAIEQCGALRSVWTPAGRVFEAAVEVCAPVIDVGPSGAGAPWSLRLAASLGVPEVDLGATGSTVGDVADVVAGFRDEYYGVAAHVHERDELPGGRPLVTSGLVDLGRCAWGERCARVAKRAWRAPVVDVAALEGRARVWAERTAAPKVVVAMQTKVVEAAVDERGTWVPGVPAVAVIAPRARLWHLAAALCSPAVTAWAAQRTAGTALSARTLKLSASTIAGVPLPVDADRWDAGAAALRRGDRQAFAAEMARAHGCGSDVAEWWLGRSA